MKTLTLLIALSFLGTATGLAQNSENHFTDSELIKLVSYIKNLEAQTNRLPITLDFSSLNPTVEDVKMRKISSANHNGVYTDFEIIKLANYIKSLEKALKNEIIDEEQYKKTFAEAVK